MKKQIIKLTIISICTLGVMMSISHAKASQKNEMTLIDFTAGSTPWQNIDDVVMGGISSSQMKIHKNKATFKGNLSLENNGGFASIRSEDITQDLEGYDGLLLRVKGDGKAYQFRLRDQAYNRHNYSLRFKTTKDNWTLVKLPFDQFTAGYRGRNLDSYPPIKTDEIRTLGLLLSDKQEGKFSLEIDWIKAYKNETV